MNIIWFTWKDKKHPTAGGAEILNEEHAKQLANDGHSVILIVGGFKNAKKTEIVDGYKVVRIGNRWTVYWEAYRYFQKHLKTWPDLIIEEINTIPFFTQFYTNSSSVISNGVRNLKPKRILLIYQLCREIWFHEIFFPLNIIGYLLEPIYLFILRKNNVLTESQSTKTDLQRYGFHNDNIHIVPVGIRMVPVKSLKDVKKYPDFTVLSLGTIRSMKQALHQLQAFELAKKDIPDLKFVIAGSLVGEYGKHFLERIKNSTFKSNIIYLGTVSEARKKELMQKSHIILVTSVKEGWGLVVTEAASQGTPAIVYNVDGLRDSVKDAKTGIICKENTPENLAKNIVTLHQNKKLYLKLQRGAHDWSKILTFQKSYQLFKKVQNNLFKHT